MDQGLKFNQIAAINLERHLVKERPAGERCWKLWNGQHRKARSVHSIGAPSNSSLAITAGAQSETNV